MNRWEIEYQNPQLRIWVEVNTMDPQYIEQRVEVHKGRALCRVNANEAEIESTHLVAAAIAIGVIDELGGERVGPISYATDRERVFTLKYENGATIGDYMWAEATVGYWEPDARLDEVIEVEASDESLRDFIEQGNETFMGQLPESQVSASGFGFEVLPGGDIARRPKLRPVRDEPQA